VTPATRAVLAHLGSCAAAPYRVLGEAAPTFGDDAAVVRAFEAARAFGAVALAAREALDEPVEPSALVSEVLTRAVRADPSGRLALYGLAVVVGPRFLVSLRDAREVVDDEARGLLDDASDLVVAEIMAVRALAGTRGDVEDVATVRAARALGEALDAAGCAESLGLGR
jgi:hypothetical protein